MERLNPKGYSLIEMLVVIAVFSILGVLITRILAVSFRSSAKSEALVNVRENITYAITVIEKHLINANKITSTCDSTTSLTRVEYLDSWGNPAYFAYNMGRFDIASASGTPAIPKDGVSTTNPHLKVTNVSFTCHQPVGSSRQIVDIEISGMDSSTADAEGASATIKSTVGLRNY